VTNNDNLKTMHISELISKAVSSRQRAEYCVEIGRRLEEEPSFFRHLADYKPNRKNGGDEVQSSGFDDNEPPGNWPLAPLAKQMLSSNFNFEGMKNDVGSVGAFVEEVARVDGWTEQILSPRQLRLWRSVVGHYRKWLQKNAA